MGKLDLSQNSDNIKKISFGICIAFCEAAMLFVFTFLLFEMSVKEEICNVHGLKLFNHSVEVAPSRFSCLDCAVLFFPP